MTNLSPPRIPSAAAARPSALQQTFAWLVHLYTATGALAALFGTLAAVHGRYRDSFVWMIGATLIDASDGVLARAARVKATLPGFDGARLDDIVDYLTFVFLPVLLLYLAGDLPMAWAGPVASVVLLSSAYGFASADAKTSDHFFTGFPSYWNIVALYLHVGGLPPAVNAAILLVLSALVFVRVGYVYPSRTPVLRTVTVVGGLVWGALLLAIALALPERRVDWLVVSLIYPAYYVVLSLVLQWRRPSASDAA